MLSFFFLCILHHSWAYVVAGVMRSSGSNMNDMQLRVGFVGQISRGLGGQGRLFGTIGCQKDLGREDTHFIPLILPPHNRLDPQSTKRGQTVLLTPYRPTSA